MAQDTSPDNLRGFIVPFPLDAEHQWDDESIMTQGTRRAGIPEPDQSSALVLQSTGFQGSNILDIKTSEAGHIQNKPKFEWKESNQSTYYGCDAANMLSHWQMIATNSGTSTTTINPRDAIKLSSTGEVLVVCEQIESSQVKIRLVKYSVDGSSVSVNIDTLIKGQLGGQELFGALCELPDESILLAHWVANSTDDSAQLYVYRSTDQGDTWTLRSKRALPDNIDLSGSPGAGASGYDLARIRMAANSSQVILLAELVAHDTSLTERNLCAQYASTSEGMKFDLVILTDGTIGFPQMDVDTVGEAFVVSWIEIDNIRVTRLSNAFESIEKVLNVLAADSFSFPSAVGVATNNIVTGQKSMWLDDDQRLFIVAESVSGSDEGNVFVAFSELVGVSFRDLGKTWIQMGKALSGGAAAVCYSPRDTDDNLTTLIGCSGVAGDQMVFCNMDPGDTGNTYKGSLYALHLGGYSTTNYPELIYYPAEQNRSFNYIDYLPIRLPNVSGWTAAGTGTETLDGDHFQLDVTASNTRSYSQTISDKTGGIIVKAHVHVQSGASTTKGTGIDIQMEELTTTDYYLIRLVIGIDYLYLYDLNTSSSTPLSSATGITNTDGLDVIIQLDNANGNIEVHYRASSSGARRYSKITGSGATAAGGGNQIKFGVTSAHVANITCDWYNLSYSIGYRTGKLIDLNKLNAKPYPPSGFFTTVVDGLKLSTKDGPARESETWQIEPRYDTPATRMLYKVQPSSRVGWRSDTIATPDSSDVPQERVAWRLDTAITANHRIPGGTLGLHLRNINFKDITLERYDSGSSAWVSVATFANGIPFNFSRSGHSISSTDSTGEFFHYAECVGWRLMLVSGETTVVRKIKFNSEGVLSNATVKQAVFTLEDAKNSDPTSGSAYLIPSSFTMLFSDITNSAGYRLNIPAQRTKEGYFEIGKMVMGPVLYPAHQYGRGRTIQFEADISSTELSNGILRSNKDGPGGRNIRIAWTEGVDISALFEAQASPNYYTSSTNGAAIPAAAEGSAPTSMLGLVSYLSGGLDALVYLPNVRRTAATEISLNRYHEHMMATMSDDVQIENVVGDEILATGRGEVMRVGTVTLREIR